MPRLIPAASLLLAVFIVACGGDDGNDDAPTATPATGSLSTPTTVATTSGGENKPAPSSTSEPSAVSVANEGFSVETSDGVVLKGHAFTPDGPKRHALIVVAPEEQSTWSKSTQAFTSEGIAVFTFDPRGYGETGGTEDAATMAADAQLIARFVMSREYPLVYLLGVGAEGGAAATEAAASLDDLSGLITYGHAGDSSTLALATEMAWNGEDVLEDSTVVEPMLTTMLGN